MQNNPGLLGGDPSTAFSADGRSHITTINPAGGYLTQNSTNGGVTWSNLINGTTQASFDKEMVAADNSSTSSFANNVYCAWSILQSINGPYFVNFNRSTNGGASFTTPITLKPNNGMGQGTNVQTGPNGEVYVCWADYDVDGTNKVIFPSHGLGFCRSTNGGVSFNLYQRVLNYTGIRASDGTDPLFNYIGMNDFPSMAVDKSNGPHRGRIYVVIPIKENGNGKSVVAFTFSDNQGVTWTTPTTISISTGRQNFFPWIAVDDCTGDVWVDYYSFDTPSGFTTNTYVAHSVDGGTTWESQKVSDVSHITAPINNAIFRTGYAGDYIGITAFGGKAYPIWMDNRNGTWQVYCSPVTSTSSPYNISGDDIFCTTSNQYTIPNLPTGAAVTWSVSPLGIATPNTPNSTQTTLTKTNDGIIMLTAVVTNVCGTNITLSKQVTVGVPTFGIIANVPCQPGRTVQVSTFTVSPISNAQTTYHWRSVQNGISTTIIGSGPSVSKKFALGGPYQVYALGANTCGSGDEAVVNFQVVSCPNSPDRMTVWPTPANDNLNIEVNQLNGQSGEAEYIQIVEMIDKMGSLRLRKQFGNVSKITLNISQLPNDVYTIRIFDGKEWSSYQTIVQH